MAEWRRLIIFLMESLIHLGLPCPEWFRFVLNVLLTFRICHLRLAASLPDDSGPIDLLAGGLFHCVNPLPINRRLCATKKDK